MLLRNLKTKFIIYIVPLILFISLSFLVFFINRLNYLIKQELTELGFSLVRDLSYSSELAVASEDETLLLPFLKGVFTQRDVVLVTVYNEKGNIIASRKKVEIEEKIPKEVMETLERERNILKRSSYTQKGEEIYDFFSPVLLGEILAPTLEVEERKLAGFARVGLSLESIAIQARSMLLIGLGITALVILFGLGISIFLAERMAKPIKQLTEGAGIIGKGNLDYQIKVRTGDEIEELAESFNRMTGDLKRSLASLEEAKIVLEIKVATRTKELKELTEQQERIIEERTKDLRERIRELERFHQLAIGRELKMIELKEEVKKLGKESKEKNKGRK